MSMSTKKLIEFTLSEFKNSEFKKDINLFSDYFDRDVFKADNSTVFILKETINLNNGVQSDLSKLLFKLYKDYAQELLTATTILRLHLIHVESHALAQFNSFEDFNEKFINTIQFWIDDKIVSPVSVILAQKILEDYKNYKSNFTF